MDRYDMIACGCLTFGFGMCWPLSALLNGLYLEALEMLLGLLALCVLLPVVFRVIAEGRI